MLIIIATSRAYDYSVTSILTGWDSHWYLDIARTGYASRIPPGLGNTAQTDLGFFPLLPLIIRVVHLCSPLSWTASGILAAFLIGFAAAIALWWLLCDLAGVDGADRGTALVMLSPGAFVLSFVYTEGLVICFVALCLLALRHRRWVLAGLCAAVVTSADPVAAAIIIPCVVASYDAITESRDWRSLWAPAIAPIGIVSFFAYLWAHTGSPFEWFHAQRVGWQNGYYFTGVPKAFAGLFGHGFSNLNPPVKVASFALAIYLVVIFVRWKPPRTWIAYVFAVLGFGVISPIIGITPRLLLRDAPLIGFIGAKMPRRIYRWVLASSVMLMTVLTVIAGTQRFTP